MNQTIFTIKLLSHDFVVQFSSNWTIANYYVTLGVAGLPEELNAIMILN